MKAPILLIGLAAFAFVASLPAQTLSLFGTSATKDGAWNYTSNNSTLTGSDEAGYSLFNTTPINVNLSTNRYISLTANVTVVPPSTFTITLEDNLGNSALANFKWSDFSGGATSIKPISLTSSPSFDYSHVVAWNLTTGGSAGGAITATFSNLSVVSAIPEPSTAFMGLAGLGVAAFALRRKLVKKAARI